MVMLGKKKQEITEDGRTRPLGLSTKLGKKPN